MTKPDETVGGLALNQIINLLLSQASASRQRAAAMQAPVGQFFGPAAARIPLASVPLLSGGRQHSGNQHWSAQSGCHLFPVTKHSYLGGTLRFYLVPRA
jgi:hypothetical protein